MKRISKLSAIFGVLISASGCILHEKYDHCPLEEPQFNVSLGFDLPDVEGRSVFSSRVSAVDLSVYDSEGNFVLSERVGQESLSQFRGVKLTLPPGMYNVVGWGNVGDNISREGGNSLTSYVTYCSVNDGGVYDCDKLYYAPRSGGRSRSADMTGCYAMKVDPATGHTGTLDFGAAHRTVSVYVEGYNGTPVIKLLGIPAGLTWLGMQGLTDGSGSELTLMASRTASPEEKEGVMYDSASFDTFYFGTDNGIAINVVDEATGTLMFAIPLNEALEETGDPMDVTVSIVIRFTAGGVEVFIPEWRNQEVDPEVGA